MTTMRIRKKGEIMGVYIYIYMRVYTLVRACVLVCVCKRKMKKNKEKCCRRARKNGDWTSMKNEYRKPFTVSVFTKHITSIVLYF